MFRGWLGVLAIASGITLFGAPAWADNEDSTRAAARTLGYAGVEAFKAGQYALASQKLDKAYLVLRAPTLGLWSARALAKQNKLLEAAERYLEVTRIPVTGGEVAVQEQAKSDAQTELEATQALTPSLIVRVDGGDPSALQLMIDGSKISAQLLGEATPVNPGAHRIEASSAGSHVASDVIVQLKEQKEVRLKLAAVSARAENTPPPSAAVSPGDTSATKSSPRRALGWVVLGGGAASIVVGGLAAGIAGSKSSSLNCGSSHSCPVEQTGTVNSYNSWLTVSTVGFVAGGVLAVTGITLLLTAPKAGSSASASLWVSPTASGVTGSF
jgi:hypothetical protein